MNVYFNAEYTGLNENAKLISLGFITDDDERLYLEIANVPEYLISTQVREAVLPETYMYDITIENSTDRIEKGMTDSDKFVYTYEVIYGDQVSAIVDSWFKEQMEKRSAERIQLISYCCHYDFCLLLNTFQGVIPDYLNPVCYDIYQKLADQAEGDLTEKVQKSLELVSSYLTTGETSSILEGVVIPDYPKDHSLKFAHLIKNICEYLTLYK